MVLSSSRATGVFISYSHKDQRWLDRLKVHLKHLEDRGIIDPWDDSRIKTGEKWRDEIRRAIASAKVAVLLISADFLASDFIAKNELPPLLMAQKTSGLIIIPVLVSPSRFAQTESLSTFQALNPNLRPLSGLSKTKQEELFVKLTLEIEAALVNLSEVSPKHIDHILPKKSKSTLVTFLPAGAPYFRITSSVFYHSDPTDYVNVVNGQGAVMSSRGARYNYPGVRTVYLSEDLETCFAERLFYYQRECVGGIDMSAYTGVLPPFEQEFVLWEVTFKRDIAKVVDLGNLKAHEYFKIPPFLNLNPSQDFDMLKRKRAEIQAKGYEGIRVPSSRAKKHGNLIVLFDDQSKNVDCIIPYRILIRLVTRERKPFADIQEFLDSNAGDVKILNSPTPANGEAYKRWQRVEFNS
jgi:hypothetical protein